MTVVGVVWVAAFFYALAVQDKCWFTTGQFFGWGFAAMVAAYFVDEVIFSL